MPPRKTPPPHLVERDLLDDAKVLVARYHARNQEKESLTADQRKAWAEQMVILVDRMAHSLAAQIGPPDYPMDAERKRIWLEQFLAGLRIPQPIDQDPPQLRPDAVPMWKRGFAGRRDSR